MAIDLLTNVNTNKRDRSRLTLIIRKINGHNLLKNLMNLIGVLNIY